MTSMRTKRRRCRLLCFLLALCCLTSMAYADDSGLPPEALAAIEALRIAFLEAKEIGDTVAMAAAHNAAEAIRSDYGYSGGEDGSGHITVTTTDNYDYSGDTNYDATMSGNSAAYFETTDANTQARLHMENIIAAAMKDYFTGSKSEYSTDGGWTSVNQDGTITESQITGVGNNIRISYVTTDGVSNVTLAEAVTWTYEKSANEALLRIIGDTPENRQSILTKYNEDASVVSSNWLNYRYDGQFHKDNYLQESGIYTLITGKEISDADKNAIMALKEQWDDLATKINKNGWAEGSAERDAANKQLEEYNRLAEEIRKKYGFSANSKDASDGGSFYIYDQQYRTYIDDVSLINDDPDTISILVYFNDGGTVEPGSKAYNPGDNQTFTFTPNDGYYVAQVVIDGKEVDQLTEYTFNNIQESHTVTVTFSNATIDIVEASVNTGAAAANNTIKAGYGFEADLSVTTSGAGANSTVAVTASWSFNGNSTDSVTLVKGSDGKYHFPKNKSSKINAQKIYIPVSTADGTYEITFTATLYVNGSAAATATETRKITVKGTMYEDDFTGDRR